MTPCISEENIKIYDSLVNDFTYKCNNGELLIDYLKRANEHYYKHIIQLNGYIKHQVLQRQDIPTCLQSKICDTATNYLRGNIPSAYSSMQQAFSCIKDVLIRKSERFNNEKHKGPLMFAFKGREDNSKFPKVRGEMFHIKFEDRDKVKDNRYSIRGMPSLYLGSTSYDCWMELGKPSLENLYFSFYCLSDISLIDLTFSYTHELENDFNRLFKKEDSQFLLCEKLIDDFLLWPLIAACSIKREKTNALFKQEYIIPQMLYQLCAENTDFCGVRYYSTKRKNYNRIMQETIINYALPAQDIKRSGYCPKLAGKLSLTEPITAGMCSDFEIIPSSARYYTNNGLMILSTRSDDLKKDETVLALDRLTMYFDKILLDKNFDELRPLYGWKKE